MGGADHGVIMRGGGHVDDEIFSFSSVNHVDRTKVSDWNEEDGSGLHDAGRTGKVDDSESTIMLWDPGITSSLQTVYMLCEDSTASNQGESSWDGEERGRPYDPECTSKVDEPAWQPCCGIRLSLRVYRQ
jgi:hypothetical protein